MERFLVHQKSEHRFKILATTREGSEYYWETRLLDGDSEYSYMLGHAMVFSCLSCDGIICSAGTVNRFVFINPATGQRLETRVIMTYRYQTDTVTLPLTVRQQLRMYIFSRKCDLRVLAYTRTELLGFGRDRESGDYKLVRLFDMDRENGMVCTQCELFSLKTREWRYIGQVPIPCFDYQSSASVNGSIYWFTAYLWETEPSEYSTKAKIVAFDLHTHSFRAVPHPREFGVREPSDRIQLMNLRDQVWIVEQSHPAPDYLALDRSKMKAPDHSLEMWRMDKGGDAWGKIYSIDLNSCEVSSLEIFTPVEIYSDGKVLIKGRELSIIINKAALNTVGLKERLLRYDPRTQTLLLTDIQPFGRAPSFDTWLLATYYQSLFPLSYTR